MAQPPSASSDPRDPCATATSTHISSPPTYNPKHNVAAIGRSLAAGGVAGAVSRTAVAPLERLKILQQVEGASVAQSPYASTLGGLRHMWQQEGLRGWLRGNGSNCVRIIPNSAIKFVFYEALTDAIRAGGHHSASGVGDELSPLQRLSAGAVAGVVGMSATYPLDMVRGRLTVDSGKGRYSGIVHAAQSIVREEGAMALYKGWLPSVLGVVPCSRRLARDSRACFRSPIASSTMTEASLHTRRATTGRGDIPSTTHKRRRRTSSSMHPSRTR